MTANEKLLFDLDQQIGNSDYHQLALFTAMLGINGLRQKIENQAIAGLEHQMSHLCHNADETASLNALDGFWARGGGSELIELAKLEAATAVLQKNPDYQAAVLVLKPLCDRREELRLLVAQEAAALAEATEAAEAAHRDAIARAQAAAECDPEVLAARQRLQTLSNPQAATPAPPLVRGRQKISDVSAGIEGDFH